MFISFDVRTEEWITREADPEDEWSNNSTDGTVDVVGAFLEKTNSYNALPAPDGISHGDTVYLIWAQYGTGDSFGSYGGKYELLDVVSSKEDAEKRKEHYENLGPNDYSVPWTGYFEWLDKLCIEEFIV